MNYDTKQSFVYNRTEETITKSKTCLIVKSYDMMTMNR